MSLEGVRHGRCGYCGWPCDGRVCAVHRELVETVEGFYTSLDPLESLRYGRTMQAASRGEDAQAHRERASC